VARLVTLEALVAAHRSAVDRRSLDFSSLSTNATSATRHNKPSQHLHNIQHTLLNDYLLFLLLFSHTSHLSSAQAPSCQSSKSPDLQLLTLLSSSPLLNTSHPLSGRNAANSRQVLKINRLEESRTRKNEQTNDKATTKSLQKNNKHPPKPKTRPPIPPIKKMPDENDEKMKTAQLPHPIQGNSQFTFNSGNFAARLNPLLNTNLYDAKYVY
jgi:hypothetical protein